MHFARGGRARGLESSSLSLRPPSSVLLPASSPFACASRLRPVVEIAPQPKSLHSLVWLPDCRFCDLFSARHQVLTLLSSRDLLLEDICLFYVSHYNQSFYLRWEHEDLTDRLLFPLPPFRGKHVYLSEPPLTLKQALTSYLCQYNPRRTLIPPLTENWM